MSDVGPMNLPALDMLTYKAKLMIHAQFDPFHRCWNDLKLAYKHGPGQLWRTMLEYSLVYNINYGPAGTKAWWDRKKQCHQEFFLQNSPYSSIFLEYLPMIARELELPEEPSTAEELEAVWNRFGSMQSLEKAGPLVKLMRWFSFFESHTFYKGELFVTKMLMAFGKRAEDCVTEEHEAFPAQLENSTMNHKEEIRQLKLKYGCWSLAVKFISPESWWKCAFMSI